MKIPEILVIESAQKAGSLARILQVIADDGRAHAGGTRRTG
jgi:hypothetical protein